MLTCVQHGSFFFLFLKTRGDVCSLLLLALLTVAIIHRGFSKSDLALIGASHQNLEWIKFQWILAFLTLFLHAQTVSLFFPCYPPLLHPLHAFFWAWVLPVYPFRPLGMFWFFFFFPSDTLQWSNDRTKLCWDKLPSQHKSLSWLVYCRSLPNVLLVFSPWGSSLQGLEMFPYQYFCHAAFSMTAFINVLSPFYLLYPAHLSKGFQLKQNTACFSTELNSLALLSNTVATHLLIQTLWIRFFPKSEPDCFHHL